MWKPIYQPDPWPKFVKRKDIIGLPLMEQRRKFMEEQILFENYVSSVNTINTVSTAAAGAAGGPAPGGGGGGVGVPVIQVKINTNFRPTGSVWNGNDAYGSYINEVPSTRMIIHGQQHSFFTNSQQSQFTRGDFANDPQGLIQPYEREVIIDWGDGNIETVSDLPQLNSMALEKGIGSRLYGWQHDYDTDGEYIITITGEGAAYMRMSWLPLVDILRWENIVENGVRMFDPFKAGIFGLVPINGPILSVNFFQAFWDNFTDSPTIAIGDIDVSQYKGAVATFWGADENWPQILSMTDQNPSASAELFTFNEDVSGWDVSNFKILNSVFSGQGHFSQNLGSWSTSNVEDMYACFRNNTRLMSGARADLWDVSSVNSDYSSFAAQFTRMFEGAMTHPSVVGSMPHVGNWQFDGIADNSTSFFQRTFNNSGFSHTAIGQSLIGWASQSSLPVNIGVDSNAFANTFNGSFTIGGEPNFSNPTYNTGSDFGLEVSASFSLLTSPTGSGGKGWTIPGFTFN